MNRIICIFLGLIFSHNILASDISAHCVDKNDKGEANSNPIWEMYPYDQLLFNNKIMDEEWHYEEFKQLGEVTRSQKGTCVHSDTGKVIEIYQRVYNAEVILASFDPAIEMVCTEMTGAILCEEGTEAWGLASDAPSLDKIIDINDINYDLVKDKFERAQPIVDPMGPGLKK